MTPFIKKIAMPALSITMAASIALTPVSATPARAGNPGTDAAVAAGFLALLMAGIVAGSQAQGAAGRHDRGPHDARQRDTGPRDTGFRGNDRRGPDRRAPTPPRWSDRSRSLPSDCRVTYKLGSVSAPYYEKSCLVIEMRGWRALPDRCAQTIRIRGSRTGAHVAYPEACLARSGFTPERRGDRRVRW